MGLDGMTVPALVPTMKQAVLFDHMYTFLTVWKSRAKGIEPTKRTEPVTSVSQEESVLIKWTGSGHLLEL